jgi:nucleotide-binding universal stress UspA family protein
MAPMSANILLAVDCVPGRPRPDARALARLARQLIQDSGGRVTVLYVREFSVARIGRMMADHGGSAGQRAVTEIVTGLRAAGISAAGLVREADIGHVARAILDAAAQTDARVIVMGPGGRPGPPRIPLGSVAAHVLRAATVPVVVMPAAPRQAGASLAGQVQRPGNGTGMLLATMGSRRPAAG